MIYQALLYSRSLAKDYRWMIVPSEVSPESLKALKQLYNVYDKNKHAFSKSAVSPLYCLKHSEGVFFVSCGFTGHKDKDGRDIYCLQGVSIANEYQKRFWLMLPGMLANFNNTDLLNMWGKINFHGADDIIHRASEEYSFEPDWQEKSFAEGAKTAVSNPAEKTSTNETSNVSFDKKGLKELSRLLSLRQECVSFAFGATPEMIKKFNFKIVAWAGNSPPMGGTTEPGTTEHIPPVLITSGQKKDVNATLDNPMDRFNPVKKRDLPQIGIPKGNTASQILNQCVLWFMSLFKIGEKIKRFRSSGQQKDMQ